MISDELANQVRRVLSQDNSIISAYFIGSMLSGKTHFESDFDLAVIVENKKRTSEHTVYELLKGISFPKDLDLSVVDKGSSPLFLFQIISRGRRIYKRSKDETNTLEAFIMHNYYDTQHLRNIYHESLKHKFNAY